MAPWNNGGHPQGCPAPEEQEGLGLLRQALGFLLPEQQAQAAAQNLQDTFGSLAGVFRAPREELVRAAGIDQQTARYLEVTLKLAQACLEDQAAGMLRIFDTRSRVDAFRPKFLGRKTEAVCLMLLDGRGRLRYNDILLEGSASEVPIYVRRIIRLCIDYQVQQAVLAHNHPSGNPLPSRSDLLSTCQIILALESIDARLVDHIIFSEDDYFSFAESGMLRSLVDKQFSLHREAEQAARQLHEEFQRQMG